MKTWLVPLAALALLAAGGGAYLATRAPTPSAAPDATVHASSQEHAPLHGLHAVLYKSPTCGCCDGYASALTAAGVNVEIVGSDAAVREAKDEHGIPRSATSCHTFTLDGYVIEGHVPLEALEKLVTERPDVDGLALPGMPSGTPGMPGPRTGPIRVLQLDGGELAPYVTL